MKFAEMNDFFKQHNINSIQPVIANEVSCQTQIHIPDSKFEKICEEIYQTWLDCVDEPDIWVLVNEKLTEHGYKNIKVEHTEYAVEVRNPDRFIAQLDVFSNIQEAQKFVENYTAPLCDGEFLNIVFINYDKNGNEISSGTVC